MDAFLHLSWLAPCAMQSLSYTPPLVPAKEVQPESDPTKMRGLGTAPAHEGGLGWKIVGMGTARLGNPGGTLEAHIGGRPRLPSPLKSSRRLQEDSPQRKMGGWYSPVGPEGHFVVALQSTIARPSQHNSTLSYRDPERSLDAREETAGDWLVPVLKLNCIAKCTFPDGR